MSKTLTPSFRRAIGIPASSAHTDVIQAFQAHDNNIVDLNQAIVSIKAQVDNLNTATGTTPIAGVSASTDSTAAAASSTSASARAATSSATENVTNISIGGGPVNNQSGNAVYITAQTDNGALIILSDTSAIAVTLNSSVTLPFYCTISNQGMTVATVTPGQGTVNGVASLMLQGGGWVTVFFDGLNWWAETPGSVAGSVTQLLAGTGITVSPTSGVGVVTVTASGAGSGVTQIIAGTNVTISPPGGTGAVTVNATGGGGSYSLGGTLGGGNITAGTSTGSGGTASVAGVDGNHFVTVVTGGSSLVPTLSIWTLVFTATRGHNCYPVISPANPAAAALSGSLAVQVSGGSPTSYVVLAGTTALAASTTYMWNVSAP